jgi:hypothetical protein
MPLGALFRSCSEARDVVESQTSIWCHVSAPAYARWACPYLPSALFPRPRIRSRRLRCAHATRP